MAEDFRLFDADFRRKLPRFLSEEETAGILQAGGNGRDGLVVKCLYYLGLTNSELQGLRAQDISFADKTVTISGRQVPIPDGFLPELQAWTQGKDLLFAGRSQGRLSDRHIRRIVKALAGKANVRNYETIHPHSLRHAYAAHLQASGVPLAVVRDLLGLARLETAKIYATPERAREWVEKTFGKE